MDSNLAQPRLSRQIRISRQQKRQLILAIPVTCLVTSLATFGWLQFQTAQAETRLQQTQRVRLETERLYANLLQAETAVRGYEITRRQDFLDRYESAIAQIPVTLDQLLDTPRPISAGILSSATHLTIIYPCGNT
ncbi:CHASE3 domain-containing protein [Coleofasciculus sp. F4-SAH-05]|uniref:CHASE3 domain-containing protein n=1 Tax=Coleofasciculus sp. F4-SAH-05 TaxID=3069525 RepID=UPI003302D41D